MGKCLFMRKGETHTTPGSRLPYGYTELTYIQSSGTQWIDTEFIPVSQNMRVECGFLCTSFAQGRSLFGSQYSSNQFSIIPYSANSNSVAWYVGTTANILNTEISANVMYSLSAETKNGTFYLTINDTIKSSAYSGNLVTQMPFSIFGNNNQYVGGISQLSSMRVYLFKIYDNDVLVRDFIPCINASGEVGLYDIVGKQFYGNAGTGVFTGSEVA